MELTQEIKDLFKLARETFGEPIRKVELVDSQLCSALELALVQYNDKVLNFIIENKWSNFYNKNQMTNSELAFAFSTNTFDLSRDYSDYYSHIVGLQQHGTKWELKKDYFEIVPGQQVYIIPAGRQICRVLRFSVNTSDAAVMASLFGGYGYGGGPMFQMGAGQAAAWAGSGFGYFLPYYSTSVFDVALSAMQMSNINGFLGTQMAHKVTALSDGSHLVHLMNVPGGLFDKLGGFGKRAQCFCWYTYYDTAPGEEDECLTENANNVYLSPDQIKLDMKHFGVLNDGAKSTVIRLFLANAAFILAQVRGKFSGSIQFIASPVVMDYSMLLDYSRTEREAAINDLKERLLRLTPSEVLKREAEMVENMKKIRVFPTRIYSR